MSTNWFLSLDTAHAYFLPESLGISGCDFTLQVWKLFATGSGLFKKVGKILTTTGRGLHAMAEDKLATVRSIKIDTFSLENSDPGFHP